MDIMMIMMNSKKIPIMMMMMIMIKQDDDDDDDEQSGFKGILLASIHSPTNASSNLLLSIDFQSRFQLDFSHWFLFDLYIDF